ncbi:LGFP repeat protein (plasmid) [Pseudarthrobacter chlorophenolicus A6]|uniref:LGFP repeat protein n=1 Tax=Pseudarthrobacter chlorophenolicus (strain ATCC 700700 / DSM 12829 / CIP 107037 / JCM 12360 / KCTC 9906 / NCIMB 13794 / A6) TaxID=452863 RepID=B8HJ01_PSECP|nr:hypothetical protein [Pseudarthrobacter chlorophenolicus]ACL42398.1 LGFP repeat protein [Pseudarthrobacter chlorophenolicus A6]SDQ17588.1 Uncharacterized conserved protein, contains LGFP repeats [Pseudarthrobacter chlorophenolicus]
MFKKNLITAAFMAAAIALGTLATSPPAQASAQVYNPCAKLSHGQTKFSGFGANRVTFATATDRNSNVLTITGCRRSGSGYVQEWQDWGYGGLRGFSPQNQAWEDTYRTPTGSFSFTEALGRRNPGTTLRYHTVNTMSRWGGERGATYNQYFEGAGGPSDENLWKYMNEGYYEQAAVINYNRLPDARTVQGASFAIFFHAGRVPSAGCVSTSLSTVTRLLKTNRPGDRIIMGAVDDVFTPYSSNPFGAITARYARSGGPAGILGVPAGNETGGLVRGGAQQLFRNGAITWSSATGARITTGAIRSAWLRAGAQNGALGYPTTEEVRGLRSGGAAQSYQGGAVLWTAGTGAHPTSGAIRAAWLRAGGQNGYLGYPVSDEIKGLKNGGAYQTFQGGSIHWSAASGAHITKGAIRSAWGVKSYERGVLGYPTSDEIKGLKNGGAYQTFQGGAIHWSAATGAHPTTGAIRTKWAAAGSENGVLGYPTSSELTLTNGGKYQTFQGGAIYWTPATGAHISKGGIRSAWAQHGYERGPLGYPTTDEFGVPGGIRQNYQGGSILWSSFTGARSLIGGMATKYDATGGPVLGFPTEEQTAALNGGLIQYFQNGAIIMTPSKSYFVTTGKIRLAWVGQGAEKGKLGYPTSAIVTVPGGAEQTFAGGSIFLSSTGVTTVKYPVAPAPAVVPSAPASPEPTPTASAPA